MLTVREAVRWASLLAWISAAGAARRYQPDWTSLNERPLPAWFDRAKFGIRIHWGVYSVPAYGTEWFWINWKGYKDKDYVNFMEKNYKPGFTYQEFGPQFTAEFFDPNQWASIIKDSGAKYVILTSKHHEGYTLWPSKKSFGWNSVDVGPHRDIVGELSKAVRNLRTVRFGLYYSLFEWYHPLWIQDKQANFTTNTFARKKVLPELHDLVMSYEPDIIWSDGETEAPDTYWGTLKFLAWLYNDSPVKKSVVVNDRWGDFTSCENGGFFTCDSLFEKQSLVGHKWENTMSIDKYSWGYRRNSRAIDAFPIEDLISGIVQTVSFGGNVLLNVSPTSDGMIPPLQEERLLQIGRWLSANGESIYNSRPWPNCQRDTENSHLWLDHEYTQGSMPTIVYTIVLKWPEDNLLSSACMSTLNIASIVMLDTGNKLKWKRSGEGSLIIKLEDKSKVKTQWGWALRVTLVS